jgi:uncharacterized repeat protein (TIGR02059 family)
MRLALTNGNQTAISSADVTAPVLALTNPIYVTNLDKDKLVIQLIDASELDETSVPVAGDFAIVGISISISSIVVSGPNKTITLILSRAIVFGESFTLAYTQPVSGAIKDSAGNKLASFTAQAVDNQVEDTDSDSPTVSSITIDATAPNKIVIQLEDESALDTNTPATSAFGLTGTAVTVTSVTVNTALKLVILGLSGSVSGAATVTVGYTKPVSNAIRDIFGNETASFSIQADNNISVTTARNFWLGGDGHEAWEIENYGRDPIAEMRADIDNAYPDGMVAWIEVGDHVGGSIGTAEEWAVAFGAWDAVFDSVEDDELHGMGNHDYSKFGNGYDFYKTNFFDGRMKTNELIAGSTFERFGKFYGNLLILVMSDINFVNAPAGGFNGSNVGYPTGALKEEQLRWSFEQKLKYRDANIIEFTHQLPKNTAIATGFNDYANFLHDGSFPLDFKGWGGSIGYLVPTAAGAYVRDAAEFINNIYNTNPGIVTLHCGGHEHTDINQTLVGKSVREVVNGIIFQSISSMTKYYGRNCDPHSYVLETTLGSASTTLKQYLHAPSKGGLPRGLNAANNYVITFPKAMSSVYIPTAPSVPGAVSNIQSSVTNNKVTLTWDGTADGFLVIGKVGTPDLPTNDVAYMINDSLGTSKVYHCGSTKTCTFYIKGNYTFYVIPFNSSGGQISYKTSSPQSIGVNVASYSDAVFQSATLARWWSPRKESMSDGDLVSTLTDYSGNGQNLAGSGASRPTFKTDSVQKYVKYSKNNNSILTGSSIVTGTNPCDAILAVRVRTFPGASADAIFNYNNDDSGGNATQFRPDSNCIVRCKGTNQLYNSLAPPVANQWMIHRYRLPANATIKDIEAQLNKFFQYDSVKNATAINLGSGGFCFGYNISNAKSANIDIGDALFYTAEESAADMEERLRHLALIYGIDL